MLYELFVKVSYNTVWLFGIVSLAGLPVVFDVFSVTTTQVVEFTYQPLGVAAFAIGVFYIYINQFQTIHLTGETDHPMILLDEDDRIRDYNRAARTLFPELSGANGLPIESVSPSILETLETAEGIIETERDGKTTYYRLTTNPFSSGQERLGRVITLSDVTQRVQYRQRLEQQNDRLEEFASVISHDLRNPLMVAKARIEFAMEEDDIVHLQSADEALDRMDELIEDLLHLAREGQQIDVTVPVDIASVAERSWQMLDTSGASLQIEGTLDRTVDADPERLQQLFENLFRNSVEHGSTSSQRGSHADDSVEHGSTSHSEPGGSEDAVEDNSTSPASSTRQDDGRRTSSEPSVADAPEDAVDHSTPSSQSQADDPLEHGGGDITVTVGALTDGTGFYIEDDGTGIPADVRDEIFEPGFTTNEDGTGFGLPIVNEIVEAHNWKIRATDGATGGARFEIQTVAND